MPIRNDFNYDGHANAATSSQSKDEPSFSKGSTRFSNRNVGGDRGKSYTFSTGENRTEQGSGFKKAGELAYPVDTKNMTKEMWANIDDHVKKDIDNNVPDSVILSKVNACFGKNKKSIIEFKADGFKAESLCVALYGAKNESKSYDDVMSDLKLYTTINHKAVCALKKMIANGGGHSLLDKLPDSATGKDCAEAVNTMLLEKGVYYRLKPIFSESIRTKECFKRLLDLEVNFASLVDTDGLIEEAEVTNGQTAPEEPTRSAKSSSQSAKKASSCSKKSTPTAATVYVITETQDSPAYWNKVKSLVEQDIGAGESNAAIADKLNQLFERFKDCPAIFKANTFDANQFMLMVQSKIDCYERMYGAKGIFRGKLIATIGEQVFALTRLHKLSDCKIHHQAEQAIASVADKIVGMEANELVNTVNKALANHGCSYRLSLNVVFNYEGKPYSSALILDDIKSDLKGWYKPGFSRAFVTKEKFKTQLKTHTERERMKQEREEARKQEQARREQQRKEQAEREHQREKTRQEERERFRREYERARQQRSNWRHGYSQWGYAGTGSSYGSGWGYSGYSRSNSSGSYYGYGRGQSNSSSDSGYSSGRSRSNSSSSTGSNYSSSSQSQSSAPQSSNAELSNLMKQFYGLTLDNMTTSDAFKIMGIDGSELKSSIIKKAYRNMSLKFHPDKFQAKPAAGLKGTEQTEDVEKQKKQAEEMFKLINNANTKLMNLVS